MRPLLVLLLALTVCFGQAGKAELFGTVLDPSGAVVPAARIEVTGQATGAIYAGASDERGEYHLLGLPAGEYTLTATAPGFVPFRQNGLALRLSDQIDVDVRLALGGMDTIDVTAQAPLLQTASGSVTYSVDQAKLSALPLDGRNFAALIALSPGVALKPGPGNSFPHHHLHSDRSCRAALRPHHPAHVRHLESWRSQSALAGWLPHSAHRQPILAVDGATASRSINSGCVSFLLTVTEGTKMTKSYLPEFQSNSD